jgi:hypothetical protein
VRALALLIAAGCSSSSSVECGEGTALQGGRCVAVAAAAVVVPVDAAPKDPLKDVKVSVRMDQTGMHTALDVTVVNGQADSIKVDWDASSYVASSGKSFGRLVRGSTRRINIGQPQPPTPVPSGAQISELVLSEAEANSDVLNGNPGPQSDPRAAVHLVIVTSEGPQTWKGVPVWPDQPMPRKGCFTADDDERCLPVDICKVLARSEKVKCNQPARLFCFRGPFGDWDCRSTLEGCEVYRKQRGDHYGLGSLPACVEQDNPKR